MYLSEECYSDDEDFFITQKAVKKQKLINWEKVNKEPLSQEDLDCLKIGYIWFQPRPNGSTYR